MRAEHPGVAHRSVGHNGKLMGLNHQQIVGVSLGIMGIIGKSIGS